jgi:hypothetical protein
MKKLLGIAVFAAALAYGAVATAAPINIIATQQGSGSNTWVLTLDTTLPVGGIAIVAPDTATFVIGGNPLIAAFGSGSSYGAGATPGLFSLVLGPSTCAGINCTPLGASTVLGTFTAPAAGFLIGPDDGSNGFTAGDGQLTGYPEDQVSVQTHPFPAPEPATAVMLGLGLAVLGLVRRKAA